MYIGALPVCMPVHHVSVVPMSPEEDIRSSVTSVTDSVTHHVGTGN